MNEDHHSDTTLGTIELPMALQPRKAFAIYMTLGGLLALALGAGVLWVASELTAQLCASAVALGGAVALAMGIDIRCRPAQWALHVNERGIEMNVLKTRRIEWQSIRTAAPGAIGSQRGLIYTLRDKPMERFLGLNMYSDDPLLLAGVLAALHEEFAVSGGTKPR
ncbi:hypothetical protein ACTSKR_00675 [Chitinibacteraceae bacterium HSL-7]